MAIPASDEPTTIIPNETVRPPRPNNNYNNNCNKTEDPTEGGNKEELSETLNTSCIPTTITAQH